MRFDIVTIFPEFFDGPLDYGILRRARATGLVEVHVEDLRDYTHDRHRTVDDRPFGGGEGMVLKPEPLFEAVETIIDRKSTRLNSSHLVISYAVFCLKTLLFGNSVREFALSIGQTNFFTFADVLS